MEISRETLIATEQERDEARGAARELFALARGDIKANDILDYYTALRKVVEQHPWLEEEV